MNKRIAKRLKAIVGAENIDGDRVLRRTYRRLKKAYNKVPKNDRETFLEKTKEIFDHLA